MTNFCYDSWLVDQHVNQDHQDSAEEEEARIKILDEAEKRRELDCDLIENFMKTLGYEDNFCQNLTSLLVDDIQAEHLKKLNSEPCRIIDFLDREL